LGKGALKKGGRRGEGSEKETSYFTRISIKALGRVRKGGKVKFRFSAATGSRDEEEGGRMRG